MHSFEKHKPIIMTIFRPTFYVNLLALVYWVLEIHTKIYVVRIKHFKQL